MDRLRLTWARVPVGRAARREIAWDLVHGLLAREGWPDAQLTNPCPRCGGPHGPVEVADAPWRASVSYAGGFALAGLYPDSVAAFAIDAELLLDPVREAAGGIDGGLLRWVRAEAVLKADGRGLRPDAGSASADVWIVAGDHAWTARIAGVGETYSGWEPDGPPGLLVSAAVRARRLPRGG